MPNSDEHSHRNLTTFSTNFTLFHENKVKKCCQDGRPCPMPHCRVLPSGECNSTILDPRAIETIMTTVVTLLRQRVRERLERVTYMSSRQAPVPRLHRPASCPAVSPHAPKHRPRYMNATSNRSTQLNPIPV